MSRVRHIEAIPVLLVILALIILLGGRARHSNAATTIPRSYAAPVGYSSPLPAAAQAALPESCADVKPITIHQIWLPPPPNANQGPVPAAQDKQTYCTIDAEGHVIARAP